MGKEKELRRTLHVFPIGSVMKLTDLTARQIRYYEEQHLISPERTDGNRRLYSLNDIDVLLEIKEYLSEGLNMAGVKRLLEMQAQERIQKVVSPQPLTEETVRRIFQDELMNQGGLMSKEPNFFNRPKM